MLVGEPVYPVDVSDDEVSDIRACGVFGAYDNEAGICLNQGSLLRTTIADIFVTADGDPAFLTDKL